MWFFAFYSVILYNSSSSRFFLQNQNIIFFPTEVVHVWLGQSWQVRKFNKKFESIRVIVIKALGSHEWVDYSAILLGNKGLYSVSNKPKASKSGPTLQHMTDLKNCRIENPSCLLRPLAQYLGSDKRWVLSPDIIILYLILYISLMILIVCLMRPGCFDCGMIIHNH